MSGFSLWATYTFARISKTEVFTSILIPTDFSPSAWKAMRVGLALAQMYQAKVSVLHVYPIAPSQRGMQQELFNQLEKVRTNMGTILSDLTQDKQMETTNIVIAGNVRDTLLDFVNRHEYDLVIMGVNSHGADNTPGTHTLSVIEQSKSPVLVVPNNYHIND